MIECSVEGCSNPKCNSRGWCSKHYQRWRKTGDPLQTGCIVGDDIKRFWSKVDMADGCWEWVAGKTPRGYGKFRLLDGHIGAHRYCWEITNGPIPDGLFVCHRCDNPPCVNPEHLFLGTSQDNIDDMVEKGRSLHGERNHAAKLTPKQVNEIRRRFAPGDTYAAVGREYGVSYGTISRIINGKAWTHI